MSCYFPIYRCISRYIIELVYSPWYLSQISTHMRVASPAVGEENLISRLFEGVYRAVQLPTRLEETHRSTLEYNKNHSECEHMTTLSVCEALRTWGKSDVYLRPHGRSENVIIFNLFSICHWFDLYHPSSVTGSN